MEWCWTFCLEDNRRLFSRIIEEEEEEEEKEEQDQEEQEERERKRESTAGLFGNMK